MNNVAGTIYLLHFDQPLAHAKHYIGWTDNLPQRIQDHASGNGARLMQVLRDAGIGFQLVRTWCGTRTDERRLKRRKGTPRLCPVCRKEIAK